MGIPIHTLNSTKENLNRGLKMALSEKTLDLIRRYGTACIKYGSAEPNSRAEAKAETEKGNAHEELYKHLEMLERRADSPPSSWDEPHWAGPSD